MRNHLAFFLLSGAFAAGLVLSGCSGDDDQNDPRGLSTGGTSAGTASTNTAGTISFGGDGGTAGGGAGGTGPTTGGSSSAGQNNGGNAQNDLPAGGNSASGGTTGGSDSGPSCTPASTAGLTLTGSCATDGQCSDQYDSTFGAATLEQICTSQAGEWSTSPCPSTGWAKKCTQEIFGGVYVIYMTESGVCGVGCEEAL